MVTKEIFFFFKKLEIHLLEQKPLNLGQINHRKVRQVFKWEGSTYRRSHSNLACLAKKKKISVFKNGLDFVCDQKQITFPVRYLVFPGKASTIKVDKENKTSHRT
jgi:hypothetical protein